MTRQFITRAPSIDGAFVFAELDVSCCQSIYTIFKQRFLLGRC